MTPDEEKLLAELKLIVPDAVHVHISPHYPPGCKHEWAYADDECGEPSHCGKCGISFTRYIFTECP